MKYPHRRSLQPGPGRFIPAAFALGLLLLWRGSAGADATPLPPLDLPPAAMVAAALEAHPPVRAALAALGGAEAEHGLLKAGEHELNLGLSTQRRSVRGGADYTEWGLGLERGLRLPGKARLDDRIGVQGVMAARERVGDARHESARQLLGLWYAARQAALESDLWRQQIPLLEEQQRIVETRIKRGDAARLERLQAESALAQARAQLAAAQARAQTARAELAARFPELPLPEDAAAPAQPTLPPGDAAHWQALVLEHNHELLAVQADLERARLQTRRAEANRLPDPTLGLHLANEQGGSDRIIGVSLNLPLPGAGRRAQARVQLAQAEVLAEQEAATRRRLTAEANANWQRAQAGVDGWHRLADAAQAVARHAALARRAHALGELGLAEVLMAQRTAQEANLAAGQARLAANEAIARLLLDAHQLWPLEQDHDHL